MIDSSIYLKLTENTVLADTVPARRANDTAGRIPLFIVKVKVAAKLPSHPGGHAAFIRAWPELS